MTESLRNMLSQNQKLRRAGKTAWIAAFFWIFACPAAVVLGGPPFVTDDPETPAWHGFEINNAFTLEQDRGGRSIQMPLLDINYGYKPNVQLKAEFPLLYENPQGESRQLGLGDVLAGVKWRFYETGNLFLLAAYRQVILPTGERRRGLGAGSPSYLLPLVAQKTWRDWILYGNLGYRVQTAKGTRDFWYEGVTLIRKFGERAELGAELFSNTAQKIDQSTDLGFNIGGQVRLWEGYNLLFSGGRSLLSGPDLQIYIALQVLTKGWPFKEKSNY